MAVSFLLGGDDAWTESDAHHTLVLGPGDHVEIINTVNLANCMVSNDQLVYGDTATDHAPRLYREVHCCISC